MTTFPSPQSPIGGKIFVLSASLPSVGAGALKSREDPKVLGTTKVTIFLSYTGLHCAY